MWFSFFWLGRLQHIMGSLCEFRQSLLWPLLCKEQTPDHKSSKLLAAHVSWVHYLNQTESQNEVTGAHAQACGYLWRQLRLWVCKVGTVTHPISFASPVLLPSLLCYLHPGPLGQRHRLRRVKARQRPWLCGSAGVGIPKMNLRELCCSSSLTDAFPDFLSPKASYLTGMFLSWSLSSSFTMLLWT